MDTILIDGLSVVTHIGVPEEERAQPQKLSVSVSLHTDTSKAAVSDDIADTIDYAAITQDIHTLAKTERKTIERFAEDIANHILSVYSPESVTVTIDKFILPDTRKVTITIHRS